MVSQKQCFHSGDNEEFSNRDDEQYVSLTIDEYVIVFKISTYIVMDFVENTIATINGRERSFLKCPIRTSVPRDIRMRMMQVGNNG
jgi:hypothetical protein